ncbi:MAG: hypothetical protein ABI700_33245, partial [Chloroflexota bacterium]
MSRYLKFVVYGIVIYLLSWSQAAFAQVTEILPVGGAISGTIGAEQAQIEYTLDIPAGELVTLTFQSQTVSGASSSSIYFQVKDANGVDAAFIPPTYSVFRADGALPYTVSVSGFNTAYTLRLEAGNSFRREQGTATLDSHLTGQISGQQYDAYTLDAEPGSLITLRYTDTHFVPTLYADGIDQRIVQVLSTANQMETDPFYVSYRTVYRLTGEAPYSLFV